ncbi:MAG: hypothetical protein ACFFB3_14610 [Candidatus Hodarchaeota archaeon]
MSSEFLVLYFGSQCPWHTWVIEQVRIAADQIKGTLEVADVTKKPELATRYRLFSPFMIVINNSIRLAAPMVADDLVKIATDGIVASPTKLQNIGPEAQAERIEPLTIKNIADTFSICNWPRNSQEYQAKITWASDLSQQIAGNIMGFIAYEKEKAVSFAEFLPSTLIPYPLPEKKASIAVINCIYPLEEGPDYRSQVLESLIDYLPHQRYDRLQVISGRRTLAPNGPAGFFFSHDFKELEEVGRFIVKRGEEELLLMERQL